MRRARAEPSWERTTARHRRTDLERRARRHERVRRLVVCGGELVNDHECGQRVEAAQREVHLHSRAPAAPRCRQPARTGQPRRVRARARERTSRHTRDERRCDRDESDGVSAHHAVEGGPEGRVVGLGLPARHEPPAVVRKRERSDVVLEDAPVVVQLLLRMAEGDTPCAPRHLSTTIGVIEEV